MSDDNTTAGTHIEWAEEYRRRAQQAQTYAYDKRLEAGETAEEVAHGRWQADYYNAAAQAHATLAVAYTLATALKPLAELQIQPYAHGSN